MAGFAQVLVVGLVASRSEPGPRTARQAGTSSSVPVKFIDVSLNKGRGFDAGFSSWAAAGSAGQPAEIFVDELNEAGQRISTRRFVDCRATAYQGMPNLDYGSAGVSIIHMKLRCAA